MRHEKQQKSAATPRGGAYGDDYALFVSYHATCYVVRMRIRWLTVRPLREFA